MARSRNKVRGGLRASGRRKTAEEVRPVKPLPVLDPEVEARNKRYFAIGVTAILLLFGIYKAIALFGVYPVPNPDFPGFIGVGRQILSFQIPTNFKRPPVLGILQIFLSKVVTGDHSFLTAGWLLNAILTPLNVLLIWQVGKKIIGQWAIFVAIIVTLNPWFLRSQVNPIAETMMVFCILSCFYFAFRRSKWAYVFASIGSMVRYECVALILIVFLLDMFRLNTKKERLLAFGWAVIASAPFLLWMLGTYVYWERQTSHYLGHYGKGKGGLEYLELLWQASFMILLKLPAGAKAILEPFTSRQSYDSFIAVMNSLNMFSRVAVVGSLSISLVYAVLKRNFNVLALWAFLFFYATVHSLRVNPHHRYCVPAVWLTTLLVWFGLKSLWEWIGGDKHVPVFVRHTLQFAVVFVAVIWTARLIPSMVKLGPRCVQGKWLGYAGIAAVIAAVSLYLYLFKLRNAMGTIALGSIVCLMIVSQHFMTVQIIDNGAYYKEFKFLIDWCADNTQPGEKIATRWSSTLNYMSDSRRRDIIALRTVAGDSFESFIKNCYDKNISYVAYSPRGSAGTKRGVEHLGKPLTNLEKKAWVGPLQMVQRIQVGKQWINIYRLRGGASRGKTKVVK